MYQRILVPVDGSETASRGLAEAIALARLTHGRLCLFHAVDEMSVATGYESFPVLAGGLIPLLRDAGAKILADAKALAEAGGVEVDTVLVETFAGRVCELVVSQAKAWQADLLVIGTHGRRGIGRVLLGSDAEQIVRIASVPVLLVRAPEARGGAALPLARAVAEPAPA